MERIIRVELPAGVFDARFGPEWRDDVVGGVLTQIEARQIRDVFGDGYVCSVNFVKSSSLDPKSGKRHVEVTTVFSEAEDGRGAVSSDTQSFMWERDAVCDN